LLLRLCWRKGTDEALSPFEKLLRVGDLFPRFFKRDRIGMSVVAPLSQVERPQEEAVKLDRRFAGVGNVLAEGGDHGGML